MAHLGRGARHPLWLLLCVALVYFVQLALGQYDPTKACTAFPALQRRGVSYWSFEYADLGKGASIKLFAPPNKCGSISWWWNWEVYNEYLPQLFEYTKNHVGPAGQPAPIEFVPSASKREHAETLLEGLANLTRAQGFPPAHLLGFNEPDLDSQSGMSASDAALLWRNFEDAKAQYPNLQIGSPGTASYPLWMVDWVAACDDLYCKKGDTCKAGTHCKSCNKNDPPNKRGCQWDFLNVHQYSEGNVTLLQNRMLEYANIFKGVRMWVTEVGWLAYQKPCSTLTAGAPEYERQVNVYGQQVLDFLDNHGLVDRYAWFSVDTYKFDARTHCYKYSSLVEPDLLTLTDWGEEFLTHNLDSSFNPTQNKPNAAGLQLPCASLVAGLATVLALLLLSL